MGNISHYTKAMLFFQDVTESMYPPKKEEGFTLQSFSYECARARNSQGIPYGPTRAGILRFALKSLPDGYLKELYLRLKENTPSSFTVVFDATFSPSDTDGRVLSDYDNALIVTGMVVNVNEAYDVLNLYTGDDDGRVGRSTNELMTTTVEFLLQSISYVGNNNYRKQLPINY
ncbi:hypothetical protein [Millionella massiliensis]|uniref:hypothetical protein n=1 Tax=Millionella massiliensis TaxID=1871023 RepID=UPI0008D9BDFD|nr:hypothetical protein [Millionella massiliensis]